MGSYIPSLLAVSSINTINIKISNYEKTNSYTMSVHVHTVDRAVTCILWCSLIIRMLLWSSITFLMFRIIRQFRSMLQDIPESLYACDRIILPASWLERGWHKMTVTWLWDQTVIVIIINGTITIIILLVSYNTIPHSHTAPIADTLLHETHC